MLINVKIPTDIISDASKVISPQYIIMEDFDAFTASAFLKSFNQINNTPQPIVPIHVDSPGGSAYAVMGVVDIVTVSKKPVLTFCSSWAMSAGSVLLAAGTKGYRYASKNASIMIHQASGGGEGKTSDLKADLEELERLNDTYMELLAKFSGKTKKFYQNLIKKHGNSDFYISAQEAKDFGLIDFVGVPELTLELKPEYTVKNVAGKSY